MNLQIALYVLLLCLQHLYATLDEKSHADDHHSNVEAPQTTAKNEDSLLHECKHTNTEDYRSYIRCLKREKRQHYGAHGSPERRACLDECFETKCESSSCIRDCHARCRKRLIETYSKTYETAFDCDGESCNQPVGNITLHLNITNILPNIITNGTMHPPVIPGTPVDGNYTDRGIMNITNVINNVNPGSVDSLYPGYNFNPYPLPPLPQITIGFNPTQQGGCFYPWSWSSCFQQFQPNSAPIDCCSNPFLRLQCNNTCSLDSRRNVQNNIQRLDTRTPPKYYGQY